MAKRKMLMKEKGMHKMPNGMIMSDKEMKGMMNNKQTLPKTRKSVKKRK